MSTHNRQDDTVKLANVVFFLKNTALQWFENHEEQITSWDNFIRSITDNFGQPDSRRQQAQDGLAHRVQSCSESATTYIQDILRLCGRANPHMTDDEKIGHLYKGIAENLFYAISPKEPKTVKNFVAYTKQYQELLDRRIAATSINHASGIPSLTPPVHADLNAYIREGVQEELRILHCSQRLPTAQANNGALRSSAANTAFLGVKEVVQDELRALAPEIQQQSHVTTICPMEHDLASPPRLRSYQASQFRPSAEPFHQRRRTDIWRTDDDRLICYYCHTPGHILRHCHRQIHQTPCNRYTPSAPYWTPSPTDLSQHTRRSDDCRSDDRRSSSPIQPPQTRLARSSSPSFNGRRRSVSPLNDVHLAALPLSN